MLPVLLISDDLSSAKNHVEAFAKAHAINNRAFYGEEEPISIDMMRGLNKDAAYPSFAQRIYALFNFDKIKTEGQNAFLKTLEERNEDNIFFLIARDEFSVLPTVVSRCKVIRLQRQKMQEFSYITQAGLLTLGASIPDILSQTSQMPKITHAFLIEEVRMYLYTLIHQKDGVKLPYAAVDLYHILEKIIEVEYQLKHNINAEFALDYILLMLSKQGLLPLPPFTDGH